MLHGQRIARTLEKLAQHNISRWALAGGLAIERRCGHSIERPVHDIDFIVASFEDIPTSLGDKYLLRHVHPDDPGGKMLMQCVDEETRIRVDVFRAYGGEMDRVQAGVVSLYDCAARAARLAWDLAENVPVAPKFARDFLRLLELTEVKESEAVWQDHRKATNPVRFAEVAERLPQTIAARPDLLKVPAYSTDANATCARCRGTRALPLSKPARMLALMGYC
jgi:hypothetical protein